MNGSSRIWAIALLLGVLVVGGTAGAAADRYVFTKTECREDTRRGHEGGYVGWLADELDLTAEQRARIEDALETHRERMSSLWREVRPRFEEMRSDVRSEISATLTSEQEVRYRELLEKHDRYKKRLERRK